MTPNHATPFLHQVLENLNAGKHLALLPFHLVPCNNVSPNTSSIAFYLSLRIDSTYIYVAVVPPYLNEISDLRPAPTQLLLCYVSNCHALNCFATVIDKEKLLQQLQQCSAERMYPVSLLSKYFG